MLFIPHAGAEGPATDRALHLVAVVKVRMKGDLPEEKEKAWPKLDRGNCWYIMWSYTLYCIYFLTARVSSVRPMYDYVMRTTP